MKITLLYENSDFLIAYKPAGLNFHSEEEIGFASLLKEQLNLDVLNPVHRLDKVTSGMVIFAKNLSTTQAFQILFESKTISKYYLALSTKKPRKKQGWIKADMKKGRRGSWMLAQTKEDPAITHFLSTNIAENLRAYLIRPYTGRTHQIRVALKSIGAPILGDERYSALEEAKKEDRTYLHAYALKFTLLDEEYTFVHPPNEGKKFCSEEFLNYLQSIKEPFTQL